MTESVQIMDKKPAAAVVSGAASSVFDEVKEEVANRGLYVIGGKLRNRHEFQDIRWSPSANEKRKATVKQLKAEIPLMFGMNPNWTMLLTEDDYAEAVIGKCDDDGLVATKNKEHAKLIYREYKSIDPNAYIHAYSLPFDPSEPVDEKLVTRLSLDHDPWEEAQQAKAKGAKK
jgi:hypothetical protein